MKISRITAIGRPIDLRYPTNRAVAVLALIAAAAGTLFRLIFQEGWFLSGFWGLKAGLSVFLAWALGRAVSEKGSRLNI